MKHGAEIRTREETSRQHIGSVPARVVDTVGAGDAFTAAMVCLHLEGKPLRECARFANHYAARVCEQPGGTPRIDRAEIERGKRSQSRTLRRAFSKRSFRKYTSPPLGFFP